MSVPDNLTAWRAMLNKPTLDVPTLTVRDLDRLNDTERHSYDQQRIALLDTGLVLSTPAIDQATRLTRNAVARLVTSSSVARRGIVLSGPSTLGKSTTLLHLGSSHERRYRVSHGIGNDTNYIPVVYLVVPDAATPLKLMGRLADWLGLPSAARRPDLDTLTNRVLAVLRAARTSMVLIDEAQNLCSNRQHGQAAASTMKAFAERLDAVFVYSGIDMLHTNLFAGSIGLQMRGRMSLIEVEPHRYRTDDDKQAWKDTIDMLDRGLLRLAKYRPGTLAARYADHLYSLTSGSIGSLRGLIVGAATDAILDHTETITLANLTDGEVDVQACEQHAKAS